MTENLKERIESRLRDENGAKVPELAEDLNEPREKIREALRELNQEHELGTNSEFRYKILE